MKLIKIDKCMYCFCKYTQKLSMKNYINKCLFSIFIIIGINYNNMHNNYEEERRKNKIDKTRPAFVYR